MRTALITLPLTALFLLSACTTNDLGESRDLTKTETGALIGAAGGAVLGAIIKDDKRASDDALLVNITSATGFDNLATELKPGYITTLNKISRVLNQYGKTSVTVIGHTDSIGTHADNQVLSEKRAQSVMDYFASQNVNPLRLSSYGKGETEPRADNSTEAGRALNRRVELVIVPVVAGT